MPVPRVLVVFGTRPEAIKVAPIILAAQKRNDVDVISCSTGQHREMLDQVVRYFKISPDIDLNLMTSGQSLSSLTSKCIDALADTIHKYRPTVVLGQGDTTSAMCSSLVAFYHQLPFVHVEAGLRTTDIRSPFPEEMNRRICSLVSTLHCAPTQTAANQLLKELYDPDSIVVTGNTVIDALSHTVQKERANHERWLTKHPYLKQGRMVLITAHRRENHGQGIRQLCQAISQLAAKHSDVQFVYPVHLNPNIQAPVREHLSGIDNVRLIPPADYAEFVWLMDRSTLILSDSGGVQEEAPSLKKPVLVCRNTTERPEALQAGATRLVGTQTETVIHAIDELLSDSAAYSAMQIQENPYGTGDSATRILDEIAARLSKMP